MKKNDKELENNSLRDLFANDKEFIEALDDALLLEKLKTPSKYCIELEDLEEKINNIIQQKNKFAFQILFSNYKRYLYKHILELEKEKI